MPPKLNSILSKRKEKIKLQFQSKQKNNTICRLKGKKIKIKNYTKC